MSIMSVKIQFPFLIKASNLKNYSIINFKATLNDFPKYQYQLFNTICAYAGNTKIRSLLIKWQVTAAKRTIKD